MHGSQAALLKFFKYDHLPENLQTVSKPCADLAHRMVDEMPNGGAELTAGLRKLLEAKDCAVRARLNAINDGNPIPPDGD